MSRTILTKNKKEKEKKKEGDSESSSSYSDPDTSGSDSSSRNNLNYKSNNNNKSNLLKQKFRECLKERNDDNYKCDPNDLKHYLCNAAIGHSQSVYQITGNGLSV
ncbi:hypothetical protein M0812_12100 [Anaeramoeba flamelloides]|uniref:SCP domain-containing protein n=1 Tax=Anaeramoeba flamelloides TaxID=1746091 RepID=A0AAV7ZK11_9EUKA|nr:hypothetical protein M0812_12100 [Anaeramoeba flamelloides]